MMSKMEGGAFDNKRLITMLESALHKQDELWRPLSYKRTPKDSALEMIGAEQRNIAVRWLVQLTTMFHFSTETFALSVTILDRFLQAVKARIRHLNCIGVTAFYLAAKTLEEDEVVPGTLELVQQSQCGCSVSEVLRMERCILDKLSWDLRAATPNDFLNIFHALLMAHYPHLLDGFVLTKSRQLCVLTKKLQAVMMDARSLMFPPSTLALTLLSLELEQFWPGCYVAVNQISSFIKYDASQVISCRTLLSDILQHKPLLPCSSMRLYVPSTTGRLLTTKSGKRKMDELSQDADSEEQEENYYEGIKRLFVEEQPPSYSLLAAMRVAN